MKVRFTPSARAEFLRAIAYIQTDDPLAAYRFLKKTEKILRNLGRFPHAGRAIPEFPDFPHREVIIPPYRFFYKTVKTIVWIVAVWHSARLPAVPPDVSGRG
jgi:toxin ParE1/3/4